MLEASFVTDSLSFLSSQHPLIPHLYLCTPLHFTCCCAYSPCDNRSIFEFPLLDRSYIFSLVLRLAFDTSNSRQPDRPSSNSSTLLQDRQSRTLWVYTTTRAGGSIDTILIILERYTRSITTSQCPSSCLKAFNDASLPVTFWKMSRHTPNLPSGSLSARDLREP